MDQKGQGKASIKQKESQEFCILIFKVNSWQHETEMSIRMNAKKIAENDNETFSMFDEYTKRMEEEMTTLNEEFSNRLNKETSSFINENRELKEKLEKLSKSMEEKRATLSEENSNTLERLGKRMDEEIAILSKRLDEKVAMLIEKYSKNLIEETTSLQNENRELKEN